MEKDFFQSIFSKIDFGVNENSKFKIVGATPDQWIFIWSSFSKSFFSDQFTHVVVCPNVEDAEKIFDQIPNSLQAVYYPGLGHDLYEPIISSEQQLLTRLKILYSFKNSSPPKIIVTTPDALTLKVASLDFLQKNILFLKKEDLISPLDLSTKLVELGYFSAHSVEETGTFSRKGQIFDIYPVNHPPFRIQYFDDFIESMHLIDPETNKTLKESEIQIIEICPAIGTILKDNYFSQFRKKISSFQPQFKNKNLEKNRIIEILQRKQLFEGYPEYFPLFFDDPICLNDLLVNPFYYLIKGEHIFEDVNQTNLKLIESYKSELNNTESLCILPSPDHFYFPFSLPKSSKSILIDPLAGEIHFEQNISSFIELKFKPLKNVFLENDFQKMTQNNELFLRALKNKLLKKGKLIVTFQKESSKEELVYLLNSIELFPHAYIQASLAEGFYYPAEDLYILSDSDLFKFKSKKVQKVKTSNPDLFAEQIASLKPNDFVVHAEFGVGKYLGLETIKIADQESDFLVIHYEGNDKVYVPVYRLNLIQKFADQNADIKIASLKSKKFNEAKNRAKLSVKKLAFDLIELQAKRKLAGGFPFSPPDHLYREFEMSFDFEETPDQMKAIDDVLEDMQNAQSMDRLVCGDVGFGKTEVAMRAAFKAVEDKKQTVVLVPTTVLALQHYNSFIKRFKKFPVNIQFLSRFKTAKESQVIFQEMSEGKIDILIGTHRLLSEKLQFHDLGLIVIDEEHRFGVAHKEKLKNLKNSVDVLTLTATPIPRTLQLSFLGLRDLSLIQTPPPRRQSIKTYIIKQDDLTLKHAIEKELSRGGQIFYVHNRVQNIEEIGVYLKELCPQLKITITHGQMNEKDLESRLTDFYEHKSDLLLTTTIIESGIDIPNANTLIISRADTFGLAQLHQLRGRIGRSDRKAYAYFVVPALRELNDLAAKRLHSIQTYADMGSGFALASCDLEIRGAGDILGGEQSGHIEAIGLELYMELLQEAIHELKGEKRNLSRQLEIQAPFNSFIPNTYISDHSTRLKYYKKLSNSTNLEILENINYEIIDIYGKPPNEFLSLIMILKSRYFFQLLGIRIVKVGGSQIQLVFDQSILESDSHLREKIVQFFMGKPKLYKLNPDHSVFCFFKEAVSQSHLFEFAKHIAAQMGVC
jgi:transcription-repair coupling factor (superfamily II helicase)